MNDLSGARSFPAMTAVQLLHVTGEWRSGFLEHHPDLEHPDWPDRSAPATQPIAMFVREPTTGFQGETWLLPADLSPDCPRFAFGRERVGPIDRRHWHNAYFTRAGAFATAIGPVQIPRHVVAQSPDAYEHRHPRFGTQVVASATGADGVLVEVAEITGLGDRSRSSCTEAEIVRVRRPDGWHAFDLLSNVSDRDRLESFRGLLVSGGAVFVLFEDRFPLGDSAESGQRIFVLLRVHPTRGLVAVGEFAWRPEVLDGRICGRTWSGEAPTCLHWDETAWALVPDGPVLPLVPRW